MEGEALHKAINGLLKNLQVENRYRFSPESIFPLKEIMLFLNKSETELIRPKTLHYLKDLSDLTAGAGCH